MACTLAGSPSDPFHRKLRQLCYRHCRFDCYRVERTSSRAGVAPAEVQRLFTAHCYANNAADAKSLHIDKEDRQAHAGGAGVGAPSPSVPLEHGLLGPQHAVEPSSSKSKFAKSIKIRMESRRNEIARQLSAF